MNFQLQLFPFNYSYTAVKRSARFIFAILFTLFAIACSTNRNIEYCVLNEKELQQLASNIDVVFASWFPWRERKCMNFTEVALLKKGSCVMFEGNNLADCPAFEGSHYGIIYNRETLTPIEPVAMGS